MTQVFQPDGRVVPVTIVAAGPCQITQVKTEEKDGYRAVQLGYGKKRSLLKPLLGHLKGLPNFRYLREFKLDEGQEVVRGQEINVKFFNPQEKVKVIGWSKGKGFQGVVKRHGFHGSPASHGHKDQLRMPGSIGATNPAHVFKGTRMAGRMGNDQVSLSEVEIIKIEPSANLIYFKGAVPGARNGLIMIYAPGELKEIYVETVAEPVAEVLVAEALVAEALASGTSGTSGTSEAPKTEAQPVENNEQASEEKTEEAKDIKEESNKEDK